METPGANSASLSLKNKTKIDHKRRQLKGMQYL